jgi:sarcosine oxidase subunit gamma
VDNAYLRHSPLAHLGLTGRAASDREAARAAGIAMGERPFRGIVNLRGNAGSEEFMAAVEQVLGVGLPLEACTAARGDDVAVLWLGPDEWWVITPDDGPGTAAGLAEALEGQPAAVTDVSESRTCIRVSGPRVRDLLAKGSPLDLHPRAFPAGGCAQGHLAKTLITLDMHAGDEDPGGPVFDLSVLNSFAEYLWLWLEDAAGEYGLVVTAE